MTKKVVVSGYYGYGNFGDEAILSEIIKRLKELNTDITVLSGNPRTTSVNYIVKSIKNFSFTKVAGVIKQSDVLISGGGSLLQDVTSLKSLLYYSWVIWLGLKYKKDVIIFAQGIGPIKNKIAELFVKSLIKKCTYVSVRDENSYNLMQKWGVDADLVCDPIYSYNSKKQISENIIGIQLRKFKTLNRTLLNKLARQIVKDFYDKKIEIFSFQDALDYEICHEFANCIKNINPKLNVEVISGLSSSMLIERLSKLEYLIAMRFHAILLAMKFGIKTTAINYDIKVEKLAAEFDIPLISMNADEDFDVLFSKMQLEDINKLIETAGNKHFSWKKIDEILQK